MYWLYVRALIWVFQFFAVHEAHLSDKLHTLLEFVLSGSECDEPEMSHAFLRAVLLSEGNS